MERHSWYLSVAFFDAEPTETQTQGKLRRMPGSVLRHLEHVDVMDPKCVVRGGVELIVGMEERELQ
jgi:hypothetical protein